jgi:hypothetical protein
MAWRVYSHWYNSEQSTSSGRAHDTVKRTDGASRSCRYGVEIAPNPAWTTADVEVLLTQWVPRAIAWRTQQRDIRLKTARTISARAEIESEFAHSLPPAPTPAQLQHLAREFAAFAGTSVDTRGTTDLIGCTVALLALPEAAEVGL